MAILNRLFVFVFVSLSLFACAETLQPLDAPSSEGDESSSYFVADRGPDVALGEVGMTSAEAVFNDGGTPEVDEEIENDDTETGPEVPDELPDSDDRDGDTIADYDGARFRFVGFG